MGNTQNLRQGGNEGNRNNAGRKRNAVRAKYLTIDDGALRFLKQVLAWEQCIPVADANGKAKGLRIPTMPEWQWAKGESAKYGLGTRIEADVSAEHSGQVQVPGLEEALKRAYGDEPS